MLLFQAVFNTQNSGIEAAMNWVMEHMGDPDFAAQFVPPGGVPAASAGSGSFVPNEEGLAVIMSMGFGEQQAIRALRETVSQLGCLVISVSAVILSGRTITDRA